MKPPPFLLGAALVFWGWQSGLITLGALMAVILEGARFTKVRWDISDEDFTRVWVLCSLLLLGAAIYLFTANEGPSNFGNFLRNPSPGRGITTGMSSARTAATVLRWLPMIFFPFVVVETFSIRGAVPLKTVSLIIRLRWQRAKALGTPVFGRQDFNIGYPYFLVTLVAASMRIGQNLTFFCGLFVLMAWGLWVQRSRRFGIFVWSSALALVLSLGFFGQGALGALQRYIEAFNPQFFSGYPRQVFDPARSRTMLGEIGEIELSKRIVVRLEPQQESSPPTYLRAASYRGYRPRVWYASESRDDFASLRQEPPSESGNYALVPGKTNNSIVNIACYLNRYSRRSDSHVGLLPLPSGCGRLEKSPFFTLQKNSAGAVLAEGPGLVMFDALFGPGETVDSRADTNEDLEVFPGEMPALNKVISDLNLEDKSRGEILKALEGFFLNDFTYSTWQSKPDSEDEYETPLTRFLLKTHSGHCEYFATATVLLLRQLGIPARYAVGYYVHETSGHGYVVRECDAHAWCLVWDKDRGVWRDFDTTPPSWVDTVGKQASLSQWLRDLWSGIKFEFAKFWWNQGGIRQYLLWFFVPLPVLLLYQILFRRGRKRHRKLDAAREIPTEWPGLDSEFYLLEKALAERGVRRRSSESLSDWLLRALDTPDLTELRRPLQELLQLHYRYRFDPLGLNEADREALKREARKCLESLAQTHQAALN